MFANHGHSPSGQAKLCLCHVSLHYALNQGKMLLWENLGYTTYIKKTYIYILPGDELGVVKHICGNTFSHLSCPRLHSDGIVLDQKETYLMCPNHMKEAHKVLSHEGLSQIWPKHVPANTVSCRLWNR